MEAQQDRAPSTKVRGWSVGTTDRYYSHPVVPVFGVSDQNVVVEAKLGRVPFTEVSSQSGGVSSGQKGRGVAGQSELAPTPWTYSGEGERCFYASRRLSSAKLTFWVHVHTGCTNDLPSETALERLPSAVPTHVKFWGTAAMSADANGLSVYGWIKLSGYIGNTPCTMEFLISRIVEEGILGMTFLACQKSTLCLDKGVIAWRGDSISLMDKHGKISANKVQVLRPTTFPLRMESQVRYRLSTQPSKTIGLVEHDIQGDTRVAVDATVCKPAKDTQEMGGL